MPSTSEKNTFRRLTGTYGLTGAGSIDDSEIKVYLDDAVYELTSDFTTPVTDFDLLVVQYHPEVIYKAAINWWWQLASKLASHHTQSVGGASQNASEKWDRAMKMIAELQARFDVIQTLGTDIMMGHLSRFSKNTMTRLGGRSEESILANQ